MNVPPYLLMILLAASCAAIVLGMYVAMTGRSPRVLWRPAHAERPSRTRKQGTGVVLIGSLLLISTLAVNFGSHSPVRAYWVLVVWVALIGGLLGVRYMVDRSGRPAARP